jgi:hypothetical protein
LGTIQKGEGELPFPKPNEKADGVEIQQNSFNLMMPNEKANN